MLPPLWSHERRTGVRVDVAPGLGLDVRLADTDLPIRLRQISTGGLLIESHEALEPGRPCHIRLEVEGRRPVTLRGHVVRSRASLTLDGDARVCFLSAVRLSALPADAAAELEGIVASMGMPPTQER